MTGEYSGKLDIDEPVLDPSRHAQDLRETWQARMLVVTRKTPLGRVVLSMMGHAYDAEVLQVLLRVVFPGFQSIKTPFICSAAKVDNTGAVVADVVDMDEKIYRDCDIFSSLEHLCDQCRRLADRMKLNDLERMEFFRIVKNWVVADRRLDPTMDPRDPDAKRFTH